MHLHHKSKTKAYININSNKEKYKRKSSQAKLSKEKSNETSQNISSNLNILLEVAKNLEREPHFPNDSKNYFHESSYLNNNPATMYMNHYASDDY